MICDMVGLHGIGLSIGLRYSGSGYLDLKVDKQPMVALNEGRDYRVSHWVLPRYYNQLMT